MFIHLLWRSIIAGIGIGESSVTRLWTFILTTKGSTSVSEKLCGLVDLSLRNAPDRSRIACDPPSICCPLVMTNWVRQKLTKPLLSLLVFDTALCPSLLKVTHDVGRVYCYSRNQKRQQVHLSETFGSPPDGVNGCREGSREYQERK